MKLPPRTHLVAIAVVAIAVVLAFLSSIGDAPIVDEVPHIGAGYTYVVRGDMRLNPEHPPLIKDLAGIALVPWLGLSSPLFESRMWVDDVNGQWQFGRALIFGSETPADTITMAARVPMLLVFILACWFVWRWALRRYGATAALIALILFAFSPTVLAHGRLVTTDLGAAAGVLIATYWFIRLLREPSRWHFVWAALSLGLALLAKFNTVLLAPFFVLVAFAYGLDGGWRRRSSWLRAARQVGLTALVGATAFVAIVWPVYLYHTAGYPPERQRTDTATIVGNPDSAFKQLALWASDKPVIRAAGHWVLGLAMVQQRSAGGNTIYYMGQVVREGGPGYFPTVYFMKETLPWWIFVAMALTALVFRHRRRPSEHVRGHFFSDNLEELAWLLWLAIYWAVSIDSTLNIGVRHLLPVFPFTILLVAGRLGVLVEWLRRHDRARLRWFSLVIALLLGWHVFESVRVWPSYLSYFNQLAGGPSGGHRFVADSNLDWGQDVRRLNAWLDERDVRKVSIDYFGWADPAYYLGDRYVYTTGRYWKDAADFIARNQSDGWIAISATFYMEATNRAEPGASTYRWLMDYEPAAVIGNSIFVWHVTE